jgi:hypothetical protein
MKKSLLVFKILCLALMGCEPSDDRPVVTEGMELKMDKQAVCLDGITTLTLTLGDSVVSPNRIKYELSPPIGSVNEHGQYIAPSEIPSSTEVTITARADFVIGSTSNTVLVENIETTEQFVTLEPWKNIPSQSYNIRKTRLDDGFALIKEQDRYLRVVKINDSGNTDWVSNFGEGSPWAISSRNDAIYIAGRQAGVNRILKMDLNGNEMWEKELPSMTIRSIAVNDQDEVYVFLFDQSNRSVHQFIVDSQGIELDQSVQENLIRHAKFNHLNELIVTYSIDHNFSVAKLDSNGNTVWEAPFANGSNGHSFDINSENQIIVGNNNSGFFNLKKFSNEGHLVHEGVFHIDDEGDPVYNKQAGILDVTALDNGEVILMGNAESRHKAFLIDNTGHLKWAWKSERTLQYSEMGWSAFPIETGFMVLAEYPYQQGNIIQIEMKSIRIGPNGTLNPCVQANT